MSLVSIPIRAREQAADYARQSAECPPHMADWYEAEIGGFFTGLRCCLPSEVVGLLVMEHDSALEHHRKRVAAAVDTTPARP